MVRMLLCLFSCPGECDKDVVSVLACWECDKDVALVLICWGV